MGDACSRARAHPSPPPIHPIHPSTLQSGKIVPLLIDSNVAYKVDDKGEKAFNHTRCFIRDDTGRRVREARTNKAELAALLEQVTLLETKPTPNPAPAPTPTPTPTPYPFP